ncbi:MAG: hypothetical protein ACK4WH_09460 [Phycisphaerales bacterium]
MRPRTLAALLAALPLALGANAQPTFGPPKPDKRQRRQPSPPPPAPTPAPDDPDGPPQPEPSADDLFAPSPEAWLDTDPPRKAPARDVEPGRTYAWRSADGLRFAYTVPTTYRPDSTTGYDIIVVCHPAGADFRWGVANHAHANANAKAPATDPARLFRPDCLVICPDGPGSDPRRAERRFFPNSGAGLVRFRDFLLEVTRTMPGRRIFLYGFGPGVEAEADGGSVGGVSGGGGGGGGHFAVAFATQFPALADGVVAYGCGQPVGHTVRRCGVPIVFVHGVKNGLIPFASAVRALDEHRAAGNRLVRLRALRAYNDFPNPVRVAESIDYLIGVRTDDPAEALARAEALLKPKPVDEYDYAAPVWFAGARELLGRILSEPGPLTGEAPFEDHATPSSGVQSRARELVKLIDAEAARHVAALRQALPPGCSTASEFYLDGGPWLGHLIAARDDFRGVKPMEDFARAMALEAAIENHKAAAAELLDHWSPRDDEVESFRAAVTWIPNCFLAETLPLELPARMKAWRRKALGAELDLDAESLEGYELVANWDEGYRKGLEAYETLWRRWRFPPAQ